MRPLREPARPALRLRLPQAIQPVGVAPVAPAPAPAPPLPRAPAPAGTQAAPLDPEPAAAPPAPPWPVDGSWRYRLLWRGEPGEASLSWQQQGGRYRLQLQRRLADRALPDWLSEGRLDAGGLQPEAFMAGRPGRPGAAHRPNPGQQDRLSWIWQAALLVRAAQPPLRPGDQLALTVTGWRGEAQAWQLRVEADAEHPRWLQLHRLVGEGGLLDQRLWLDPARGHLPVRLLLRFDDAERWGLELDDSLPPVAASAPPGP